MVFNVASLLLRNHMDTARRQPPHKTSTMYTRLGNMYAAVVPLFPTSPSPAGATRWRTARETLSELPSLDKLRCMREVEQTILAARRNGQNSIPFDTPLPPCFRHELKQLGIHWLPPQRARLQWK